MAAEQKRKIKWAISLFLVILYFSGLTAYAQYGGGSGTAEDPLLIYTAEQMNSIGLHEEDWNKHFKLMDDIDLAGFTGTDFNIIGYYVSWYDNKPFTGVLDGNGKKISNFSYTSADANGIGLFGCILGANVHIKDLGLINPNVNAGTGNYVGSLVGYLAVVNITNCYVEGGSVSGNEVVGGLVGLNDGAITDCYSRSSVSGDISVGGLGGENKGTITNCYATGSVSGDQKVGGLVGLGRTEGIITNSYATGSVSGNQWVGGLVGYNMSSQIYHSFWDTQTSGQPTSSGGRGKTTAEMKMTSTFVNEGWDFSTPIWTINEGVDYPRLWWERQEPSKYGGGRGTAEEPYLIHTAQQMNAIGLHEEDWGKYFKLMADIDLSTFTGTDFNLIGYYINENDREPFTGVFDGNGHTISHFSYNSGLIITEGIGLFRYVRGSNMEIKDLGLIDPNVVAAGGNGVGSLVGIMEYGSITNCYVQNGHISGKTRIGGLLGRIFSCVITDCHVEADVSGFDKIGGLVGVNYAGMIIDCSSVSDVFGVSKIGGLVGVNEFLMEQGFYIPGNITGCCAEGKMEGLNCIGGLVGDNLGRVTDSYATADVFVLFVFQIDGPPGGNRIGGLVGHNYGSSE